MTLILAHKGRQLTRDLTMLDADGDMVSPGANDVVRVKVSRTGQTLILDLDSVEASANGSTVTKNTPSAGVNRVKIVPADMSLLSAGVYSFELSLVDNADSQRIKHVDSQIMVVQDVPTGDVGMT